MAEAYVCVDDVIAMWRSLTLEELSRTEKLLPIISDSLRQEALNRGKDLDEMIESGKLLENVVKDIVVACLSRLLRTNTEIEPMTQYSESALGYSVSGTFLNSAGSVYFTNAELGRLGLLKQRYGVMEIYGEIDKGNNSHSC